MIPTLIAIVLVIIAFFVSKRSQKPWLALLVITIILHLALYGDDSTNGSASPCAHMTEQTRWDKVTTSERPPKKEGGNLQQTKETSGIKNTERGTIKSPDAVISKEIINRSNHSSSAFLSNHVSPEEMEQLTEHKNPSRKPIFCRNGQPSFKSECAPFMVDLASAFIGGQIASTKGTITYKPKYSNPPDTVIKSTMNIIPGENWHFVKTGTVVISLPVEGAINGCTLHHVNRKFIPPGFEKSMPRDFEMLSLKSLQDKDPISLGNFTYLYTQNELHPAQTFIAVRNDIASKLVEFQFKNNYGGEYTAIYKIEVHADFTKGSR